MLREGVRTPLSKVPKPQLLAWGPELVNLPGVDPTFAHNCHAACDPKQDYLVKKTNK